MKADRIYALVPIEAGDRGDGRRTYVHVDGLDQPLVASRSERAILADVETALMEAAGVPARPAAKRREEQDEISSRWSEGPVSCTSRRPGGVLMGESSRICAAASRGRADRAAGAASPGQNGKIAYHAFPGCSGCSSDIYSANVDGTAQPA